MAGDHTGRWGLHVLQSRIQGSAERDEEGCGCSGESQAPIHCAQVQDRRAAGASNRRTKPVAVASIPGRLIFRVFRLPSSRQPGLSLRQQSTNFSYKPQQLLGVSFDRGLTAEFSPTLRNRRGRVLSLRNRRLGVRNFRIRNLRLVVVHPRFDAANSRWPTLRKSGKLP
jgi:hypothetical protein